MNFQEQMNLIMEHWEKFPIPEDFQNTEQNKNMSTVEGIQKQLDDLPSGPGTIYVAIVDENNTNNIAIKPLEVFKQ